MTVIASAGSGASKERAALMGVIAGLVDTLVTLLCLLLSQSTVILADFFKTALEFIAVLMAWFAIRQIERGAKHQYDYGGQTRKHLQPVCQPVDDRLPGGDHLQRHPQPAAPRAQSAASGLRSASSPRSSMPRQWRVVLEKLPRGRAESSPIMAAQARLFSPRPPQYIHPGLAGAQHLAGTVSVGRRSLTRFPR
jgi:hypothetical protein